MPEFLADRNGGIPNDERHSDVDHIGNGCITYITLIYVIVVAISMNVYTDI